MDEVKNINFLEAMRLAISEAKKGIGFVSPNPPVGCVILDSNYNFLASGYHHRVGEDHAEVDALKKIKDKSKLKGAYVVVTLEPCSHVGRTASCANTLAQLPISSVVYGLKDPNPLVAGRGLEILTSAGIHVECLPGVNSELESLAEIFLYNMRFNKCFIALKAASSIDGQVALSTGESQWITGSKSREHGHYLRGVYDATAIGYGTYLKDNPSLDIRHGHLKEKTNKIVLFDREAKSLESITESNIFLKNKAKNIYLVVDKQLEGKVENKIGVNILFVEHDTKSGPDLDDLHKKLFENKIYSLYIEGGAKVLSYFIAKNTFNALYVFLGAKLLGHGLSWTKDLEFLTLKQVPSLKLSQFEIFNNDILLKYIK